MKQLTEFELQLSEDELFYQWLLDGRVDFNKLSNAYVCSLKEKDRIKNLNACGLAYSLSNFMQCKIPKGQEKFIKAKSAYHLIKSKFFTGTPFEKDMDKIVKESGYTEDDSGIPHMETKLIELKEKV